MSISTVTSEALQLKLRQLLPSQQGFGTDLSASDTIIPVIDLTSAAEGSDVPEYLQTSLAFGSQTAFSAQNGSDLIENSPGFYRIYGTSHIESQGSGVTCTITVTDGSTTKVIYTHKSFSGAVGDTGTILFDFIVFLTVGESISAVSSLSEGLIVGSSRQVADTNGTLVQPVGFTPQ